MGGLFGGLDLALGDPLVVGHRHPVDGEINHVDRLLGGVIDGGLSTLHAGHVLGIQDNARPVGQGGLTRIDELLMDDPAVVGNRGPTLGGV
ncbi:hypothetical protein CIP107503_02253 [Corynebacterium diphtheriae]|nr:hypothetical protein CIP107503_02253 [Corynebacterium diphtheriae]CAB1050095.1 hypothetical protein NCTC10648_02333 [Corynebacterium diphtheriae]